MGLQLKPLREQVLVITGPTSGIGLATARRAARRGAKLVLASRNESALRQLVAEITAQGGQAISVVTDVGDPEQVHAVADAAVRHFGGFDTWVNNAAVAIYGRLTEVSLSDARRLFDTNFWGYVHGSRTAAEHLRHRGGVLINVGTAISERIVPLLGMYNASKFAIQGLTDTLRQELEEEGAPIAVTLINPSAVDTPITTNAKNYLDVEPKLPPPLYAPEVVAETILYCAERPVREVVVGGSGKLISMLESVSARLVDTLMEWFVFDLVKTDRPNRTDDSLYTSASRLEERGNYQGYVLKRNLYTWASLHPKLAGALAVGTGLAAVGLWRLSRPTLPQKDGLESVPTARTHPRPNNDVAIH